MESQALSGRQPQGRERRAGLLLRSDAEFLSAVLDTAGMLVVALDPQGRIVLFNPACEALTGYSFQEMRGKFVWDLLLVPEEVEAVKGVFGDLCAGHFPNRHENYWVARGGERRWIAWSNTALRGADGSIKYVIGTGLDLTRVKLEEEARSRLASIVESSEDAIIGQALEGHVTSWNAGAERIFGYSAAEVLGQPLAKLFPSDSPCALPKLVELIRRGERVGVEETVCTRKDGRRIHLSVTPSPMRNPAGRIIGVSVIARDVSDRHRAVQRQEAEHRATSVLSEALTLTSAAPRMLQAICESIEWSVGELWRVDREGGVLRHVHTWHGPELQIPEFEEAARRMAFAPGLGMEGRAWSERRPIWLFDASASPEFARRAIARQAGLHAAFAFPLTAGDAAIGVIVCFNREALEPDEALLKTMGAIGAHVGLLAERNRAVQNMAENEARMRAIVETAVEGIITIDENGMVDSLNPAAERLFGFPASEIVGKNVRVLMPSPYREEHDSYLANYLKTGKKKIIGIGREVVGRRKDGTTFPLYLAVGEMYVGNRRMFTGILRDLSELKAMQDEVVRSRSLAAIGETAATIAHEIKNPLGAISAPIQVLLAGLEADDPRREIMGGLLGQVKRLDDIVRQLMLLAKPWIPKKELCRPLNVARRVIEGSRGQPQFGRIRVALEGAGEAQVMLDAALLEQVLWNLVLNAAEAMREGGEIAMQLEETKDLFRIIVLDNGPGIPPETQAKLFQPFFTTKPRGSGLGLSICRKIMEAHGGSIEVASRPTEGTRVVLVFPRM